MTQVLIGASRRFTDQISIKTAKALGLTIPESLLLRADKVVQYLFIPRWPVLMNVSFFEARMTGEGRYHHFDPLAS